MVHPLDCQDHCSYTPKRVSEESLTQHASVYKSHPGKCPLAGRKCGNSLGIDAKDRVKETTAEWFVNGAILHVLDNSRKRLMGEWLHGF